MSTTLNYGWQKPADREAFLETLLQSVLVDIDADLKAVADTPYAARVYNSANISVSNATATALTFNSERRDDGTLHDTGSNTDRLTAPVTGWYAVYGAVEFAANSTGIRAISFRVGATPDIYDVEQKDASTSPDNTLVGRTSLIHLTAGDYVRLFVYQNSGGALNVNSAAKYSPEFGMILLKRT